MKGNSLIELGIWLNEVQEQIKNLEEILRDPGITPEDQIYFSQLLINARTTETEIITKIQIIQKDSTNSDNGSAKERFIKYIKENKGTVKNEADFAKIVTDLLKELKNPVSLINFLRQQLRDSEVRDKIFELISKSNKVPPQVRIIALAIVNRKKIITIGVIVGVFLCAILLIVANFTSNQLSTDKEQVVDQASEILIEEGGCDPELGFGAGGQDSTIAPDSIQCIINNEASDTLREPGGPLDPIEIAPTQESTSNQEVDLFGGGETSNEEPNLFE